MIGYTKIAFWWLIPLVFVFNLIATQKQFELNEINHAILIHHPGEEEVVKAILTEVQNKEGLPIEYYMNVKSVICLAEVCKVIPVTLYWNNVGEYQRYQIQKGATLEKYEADLFEPEDYKKLHTILKNPNSPFKDVFIEDIWTVPSTSNEDVDAISGETILELDENDTVPGAALTCFTLWHWANGDVVSIIKDKTSKSVSNEQLIDFIANKNEIYFNIALQALIQRKMYSDPFVNVIIQRVLKDDYLLKEAFIYLENTPPEMYLDASSQLFFKGKKEQKIATIRSLVNSDVETPKSYLDSLSVKFVKLGSFQEVSVLFQLIENKNHNSQVVNKNVILLLDSDFLIARRAYWFLNRQELTKNQESKLEEFYKKNKEKL